MRENEIMFFLSCKFVIEWLPIRSRIDYKCSIPYHNFFSHSPPAYFSELLHVHIHSLLNRLLCSFTDTRIQKAPIRETKLFIKDPSHLLIQRHEYIASLWDSSHPIHILFQKKPTQNAPFQDLLYAISVSDLGPLLSLASSRSVCLSLSLFRLPPTPTLALSLSLSLNMSRGKQKKAKRWLLFYFDLTDAYKSSSQLFSACSIMTVC